MSFSGRVKTEIMQGVPEAPCCVAAACYGVACFARAFGAKGLVLHTENEALARWALDLYAKAGVAGAVRRRSRASGSWEFAVKAPYEVEKVLAMFGHSGDETALRLRGGNLECEGCFSVFTAAAFLCCGTIIDPEKGYTLEFVSPRFSLMKDFAALLAERGFSARRTIRKGANVLYFKQSEQIEDLLTTMGATQSALEIMNLKVYRDLRNKANRITNCETANIDKIVAANRQTLQAIAVLEAAGALEALPAPLREAAALRKAHPDLPLADLIALASGPVSKSGLSHRYRRIRQRAEELPQLPPKP